MVICRKLPLHYYNSSKNIVFISKSCFSSTKWIEPNGFETGIKIYNSAIKEKVALKTQRKGILSWYSCGPTVYDSAHIGHASCYIKQDIIRRILLNVFKINVVFVLGITDIDDKIIHRANALGKEFTYITSNYEKEFFIDSSMLNILPPTVTGKVSDYIPHIIQFIEKLVKKGFGYTVNDGSVYFPVNKFKNYGYLHPAGQEPKEGGEEEKQSHNDFALWKGSKAGEPYWLSPWGKGRPGWHIECSAIASSILGDCIDIHSGGVDLLFPHHENEEAQSCCFHGVHQWVNYWLHIGHLHLKGNTKMSKSLQNTILISDFLKKYSFNEMRMFCLLTKYRNGIEYSESAMENAVNICKKLDNFFDDCLSYIKGIGLFGEIDENSLLQLLNETDTLILEALADDFDTPKAVSHLLHLISATNKMLHNRNKQDANVSRSPVVVASVKNFVGRYTQTFGMDLEEKGINAKTDDISEIMETSLIFRSHVRNAALSIGKDKSEEHLVLRRDLLKFCDNFRKEMFNSGIILKDQGEITTWTISKKNR